MSPLKQDRRYTHRSAAFLGMVATTFLLITNFSLATADAQPGLEVVQMPSLCAMIARRAAGFENAYSSRIAVEVLRQGDSYLASLSACNVTLYTAGDDFPASTFLRMAHTGISLQEADVALKLGYAALRAKLMIRAKAYFVEANGSAGHVKSDSTADQQVAAFDIMKKSKQEVDRLEKEGF